MIANIIRAVTRVLIGLRSWINGEKEVARLMGEIKANSIEGYQPKAAPENIRPPRGESGEVVYDHSGNGHHGRIVAGETRRLKPLTDEEWDRLRHGSWKGDES